MKRPAAAVQGTSQVMCLLLFESDQDKFKVAAF